MDTNEPEDLSQEEYDRAFGISGHIPDRQRKALESALDIRKFEIELYWKRAAYFWTFIAASLAGYGAIQVSSIPDRTDLSVFLSCLGIVLSFGWYCVNRGSKQWQENWENHVDLLEDNIIGPLYKITLKRRPTQNVCDWIVRTVTGPYPFCVSKVNQMISLYVTILWIFLLFRSLPKFALSKDIDGEYLFMISLTFIICILFVVLGKTYGKSYPHLAKRRQSGVMPMSLKNDE